MALDRSKSKGRKSAGRFAGIPHIVMHHPDYKSLPGNAVKLLLDLARQYNGYNNGDLTAAWGVMQHHGFRSKATVSKALQSLLQARMIVRTREGYFTNPGGKCALYALTWNSINECPGKDLEIGETRAPYRSFAIDNLIDLPSTETVPGGVQKLGRQSKKQVG